MFRYQSLRLENFRCFEQLELTLEKDLTLLFAENGGGKSALLTALAMGIAMFQPRSPNPLKGSPLRDCRQTVSTDGRQREPAGSCTLGWEAAIGTHSEVNWETTLNPASGRKTSRISAAREAIESTRIPGQRWPLFAFYGTYRMASAPRRKRPTAKMHDRWDGYADSLEPSLTDAPLLDWLEHVILTDLMRQRRGEPEDRLDEGVMEAMVRATPEVAEAWYDPREAGPVMRFDNGQIAPWSELSDGFHVFLGLIGDIARRALLLNGSDGKEAPQLVEGTVLIDEIDLHLHPRWQRVALDGLRNAFPKLQLVVTTHSPQVLSSVKNRQVRRLTDWQLQTSEVHVQGRDSNAILREQMHTDDRDEQGTEALRALYEAIDRGHRDDARQHYQTLLARWGALDPELIRARVFLEEDD